MLTNEPSPEVQSLQRTVTSLNNNLNRYENDIKTMKQINDDLKSNNDALRKEKDQQSKKIQQLSSERSDLLMQLESLHRESDINLSVKQAEIDKLQQKLFTFEQSTNEKSLKKRLELEIPYRLELESKDMEIDKIRDFANNLSRENESLKTRLETMRYDWENDVRNLKNKHKIEVNELKLHVSALQPEKEFEKSSIEVIREKNREIEDLKKKVQEKEGLISRLRKEKTEIIDSNFSQYETLKKMLELEKLEKRNLEIASHSQKEPNREFMSPNENHDDIYIYYEKKYENIAREKKIKEDNFINNEKELKELLKKKEEEIREKEEKNSRVTREKSDLEREFKEVLREKDRLLEENLNLNEKVRTLKAEIENLLEKMKENLKNEDLFEENKRLKEKAKDYKEKLKLANEKIMGFLEEKMRNNNNSNLSNLHNKSFQKENNNISMQQQGNNNNNIRENDSRIVQSSLPQRSFYDLNNLKILGDNNIIRENQQIPVLAPQRTFPDFDKFKIIEENRILREKAIRFTQNLMMD